MKRRRRRLLLGLGLLAIFGAAAMPAAAQTSQFKGLAAVSRELSSRIAPANAPIELDLFLPAGDMESLLGAWSNFGSEHAFRNGVPNSLNMVIWHVTLSRFAAAMGESCAAPRLQLHPRFGATVAKLCAWPADSARAEPVLLDFWLGIMGYNAPESEYVAWRDFFLGNFRDRTAADTIEAMTLAIAMNPYFLLHK